MGLKKIMFLYLSILGFLFFVRIFDKSSVEILYFNFCKTLKRYDILLKYQYQSGFAKRNVIDFTRIRDIKGNSRVILNILSCVLFKSYFLLFFFLLLIESVMDYVEMLDKYYGGDIFLSFMKERHIFGRFIIVLGCPRSDHKLQNMVCNCSYLY